MNATDTAAPGSLTDEREGFPRLKARFARMTDETLCRLYLENSHHCLHGIHCQNMQREQDVLASVMLARGITEIPNAFRPITVKTTWKKLGPSRK